MMENVIGEHLRRGVGKPRSKLGGDLNRRGWLASAQSSHFQTFTLLVVVAAPGAGQG